MVRFSMPLVHGDLKQGLKTGAIKGRASFAWICKLLIPAAFVVTVLQWAGFLHWLETALAPLMTLINLPGEAALPIISGMLMGNYVTIAILAVLPFSLPQITLISVFSMIAHNLIVEGVIQHNSGLNIAKITVIRIAAAALTVWVISHFYTGTSASITVPAEFMAFTPFRELMLEWLVSTGLLVLRVFGIIMGIMIALEIFKITGWIENVIRFFRPVMRVLGLPEKASPLWVITSAFGLMFGGAVIMEEATRSRLTKKELEHLHISIGINHSMVEDPLLFLALGVNALWLWIPKLLAGISAVQIYRGGEYLRNRLRKRRAEGSEG